MEPAARPTRLEKVGPAAVLPHGRVNDIRFLGIHGKIGTSCILIDVKNPLPTLPTVGRLIHAALFVGIPEMTHSGHINNIRITGMNKYISDALGIFQTHQFPRITAIRRLVYPGTH